MIRSLLLIIFCSGFIIGCGGSESDDSDLGSLDSPFKGACEGVNLNEESKNKLMLGLTLEQSNTLIGCSSDQIVQLYVWSNTDTMGFGVQLDEKNQVNYIIDFEDRVKCAGVELNQAIADSIARDMSRQQVDVIIGCNAHIKTRRYTNSVTVHDFAQYINDKGEMIVLFFDDGVVFSSGHFRLL